MIFHKKFLEIYLKILIKIGFNKAKTLRVILESSVSLQKYNANLSSLGIESE